jgi:sugar phosphate isomerase/epimerase
VVFGTGAEMPLTEPAIYDYTTIMKFTRRQALAGMALATPLSRRLAAQRERRGPMPRSSPALCLYSDQMRKVGYSEMGQILGMLGFDGVEITVQTGGHVPLEGDIDLHLERSIEAMTGSGIEVPVVSTSLTTATNKALQTIMWWVSEMGVPIFRPGHWQIQGGNMAASAVMAQREIAWLAQLGRNTKLQVALHNSTAEFVGSNVADLDALIRPFDLSIGFDFDIGYATAMSDPAGGLAALQIALPRLKAATVRDVAWTKDAVGAKKLTQCPLGEGTVDWPKFFGALAKANYAGPITLQVEYEPKDELAAIRKDLAFLKKQRAAAYGLG